MKSFVDLSTAGIHVTYGIEETAGTKPTVFTDIPNPKSIPDMNPETSTYDVTSLNDTVWKRYVDGLKDPGGAIAITFGMSDGFREMWEGICDEYETAKESGKKMWMEFFHPSLTKGFFFTCAPSRMGWAGTDVDNAWDTTVSVTPTGEIGWSEPIAPSEKIAKTRAAAPAKPTA